MYLYQSQFMFFILMLSIVGNGRDRSVHTEEELIMKNKPGLHPFRTYK
jgi:hypothetical protein